MKRWQHALVVLATLVSLPACGQDRGTAAADRFTWREECVGNYTVALPGQFEYALMNPQNLVPRVRDFVPEFVFINGQTPAAKAKVRFWSSQPVDAAFFKKFIDKNIQDDKEMEKKSVAQGEKDYAQRYPVKKIDDSIYFFLAPNGAGVRLFRNQRIYSVGGSDRSKTLSGEELAQRYLNSFSVRPPFTVPASSSGFCFPHGYLNTSDIYNQGAAVVRLVEHPDVEIYLDVSSIQNDEAALKRRRESRTQSSKDAVEAFWSHHGATLGNQLQGSLDHHHSIELAGFKGSYAMATIARANSPGEERFKNDDETDEQRKTRIKRDIQLKLRPLDYGFMAAYHGDSEKTDDVDIHLYVIRTAERAIAAGKIPISEEQLKSMALLIAQSLKKR